MATPIEVLGSSRQRPERVLVRVGERVLELSATAHLLLQGLAAGEDSAALTDRLAAAHPRSPRPALADVERAAAPLRGYLTATGAPRPALWLRRPVLKAPCVAGLARGLAPLVLGPAWAPGLLLLLLGLNLGLLAGLPVQGTLPAQAWWGLPLALLGLMLVHELGHAAAAQRFGAPPQDIGIGLFWVFPALYTDVTRIWTLPARERMVVNLAGALAQLAANALLLAVAGALAPGDGAQFLRLLVSASLVSCLVNLLPFSRLDGYWVVVDWLDMPRLHQRCARQVWRDLRTGFAPLPAGEVRHPRAFRAYAWAAVLFQLGLALLALRVLGQGLAWIGSQPDPSQLLHEACSHPMRSLFGALLMLHVLRALGRLARSSFSFSTP